MSEGKTRRRRIGTRLAAVLALGVFLGGCSSVPDAINPVEWYKGARDYFFGDDKGEVAKAGDKEQSRLARERYTPAPGAEKPIPKLSTVPQRPKTSTADERRAIASGLVADPEPTRRYSTEVVSRQGAATNPLPDVPQSLIASGKVAPQPAAVPRQKVLEVPARPVLAQPRPIQQALVQPRPAKPAPAARPRLGSFGQPRMASIPAVIPPVGAGDFGTVIVSGSGVQTVGGRTGAFPKPVVRPMAVPGPIPGLPALRVPTAASSRLAAAGGRGSYQVATIFFDNGSSALRARDRRILRQVAAQHRRQGGVIRVVGHASSRTRAMDVIRHKMVNFKVSTARAESVARALQGMGAKAESLFVAAASDRQPRYHEYMPTGEAGNRRAEVFIEF